MAGIIGIVNKNSSFTSHVPEKAFELAIDKLCYTSSQIKGEFKSSIIQAGCVIPICKAQNNCLQVDRQLGIYMVIEGLVFIDASEKLKISKRYGEQSFSHDYQWLPLMLHCYGSDFVNHISGWYNICGYNEKHNEVILVNDELGYLPLYYYENVSYFMFSSKVESLLASGLMDKTEFDITTFAEHLFFNYPLTDNTYIKEIKTVPNATIIRIKNKKVCFEKYWNLGRFFNKKYYNKKSSIESINEGLRFAVSKLTSRAANEKISISLTGGWDSRIVLSLIMQEYRNEIYAYSFGAPQAPDILIPQYICEKEGLEYVPFILDQKYLDRHFMINAKETIELSNGTRSYKRAHYLYSIKDIACITPWLMTGIFGDEVLKIAQISGGTVLAQNTIDFLESRLDINKTLNSFVGQSIPEWFTSSSRDIVNEFGERLDSIKTILSAYDSLSEKYYILRFEYNLRKYFGNEASSYNDFIYGFSPFIDMDFLREFSRTYFFGTRFPFNSNSIKLKKMSTQLYYDITQTNYKPLTRYYSSRGYSMADVKTISGMLKIFHKKYLIGKERIDAFNTGKTDLLFIKARQSCTYHDSEVFNHSKIQKSSSLDSLQSLDYWTGRIKDQYFY